MLVALPNPKPRPEPVSRATPGWRAELALTFAERAGRTVLRDASHVGPLMVQRPFYPAAQECHVYVLHPPAGVVGGDSLTIRVAAQARARVLLTTPAANKFYRSDGRIARQRQELTVGPHAILEWLPQETLYFNGTIARCVTRLELDPNARFIGWEFACYGRPCCDEVFTHGRVETTWSINGPGGRLLETQRIDAAAMKAVWGLRGHCAMGTFYVYPSDSRLLDSVRSLLGSGHDAGCTLLDTLLVVRVLATNVTQVRELLVSIWRLARQRLLACQPCIPRIWAT